MSPLATWAIYFAVTVTLEAAVLVPLFRAAALHRRLAFILLANLATHPLVFSLAGADHAPAHVLGLELFAVIAEAGIYACAGVPRLLALGGSAVANAFSLGAGSLLGTCACTWLAR